MTPPEQHPTPASPATAPLARREVLILGVVLVAASHAVTAWIAARLRWAGILGPMDLRARANLDDVFALVFGLLLCLGAPRLSGLRLGEWRGHALRVLGVCALPVALTAAVYPLTSRPFQGERVGVWLVSPAAQELLFSGFLFGLFARAFPGSVALGRARVAHAVLLTAAYFALWHVPNFGAIGAAYVAFQLVYTFLGGAWTLQARQWTGSVLPGIATHMAVNYLAWRGW